MSFLKNKKVKIILSSFLVLILISGSALAGYTYYQLNKIKVTEISKTDEDLGIDTTPPVSEDEPAVEMDEDIVNIALFGTDRRNSDERARTDTIMIATIDKKHKKIKLSSIMRDSYVKINGHGMDKITHAYFFGGPQLAIRTINENFKMDIRDFVLVDFFSLEKIIDILGGVTIDVKEEEIKNMNQCIWEAATLQNVEPKYVTSPGVQVLNGMQAVGYGRIRYVGNGDYERTDRQRKVLSLLLEKISKAGALQYPYIVSQLLPYVETSMDKATMLKLGAQVFAGNMMNIEQQRFPLTKASRDTKINDIYYLWLDLNATANHIHEFIYDDIIPEVKSTDKIAMPPKTTQNNKTTTSKKSTTSTSKKTTSNNSNNTNTTDQNTEANNNTQKETNPQTNKESSTETEQNANKPSQQTNKQESNTESEQKASSAE